MVTIHFDYRGELRCEARHAPSEATLFTDAPVDNKGRGASFSPTDLVATALGSCMLTIMGILAEERGRSLDGCTARVEKGMVADPLRRIGSLTVEIRVPGEWSAEERRALEEGAHSCPVAQSVRAQIDVQASFFWGA